MVNQIEKTDDIVTLDSIKRKFVSRCSMNHNKNQNEIKDWTSEDDNASEKECKIPLDYELLPEEFFLYKEIPFPLVSKSWLKSLKQKLKAEDEKIILAEESEDDSIPLAKLKEKLNKNNFEINCNLQRANDSFNVYDLNVSNRTLPNVKVESSSVVENSPKKKIGEKQSLTLLKKTDDTILVSRKRGRPRKPEQISDVKNEFPYDFFECSNDSDSKEDVWKDSEGSFNFNFHEQGKPADELKEKIDIKSGINCKKHDYFKSREIANKKHENDDQESVKNKKKEENDVVGGKAENAKIAYLCFECGKSFSAASTLKNHKRIHE